MIPAGRLAVLSAWRLVVAGCGATGFALAVSDTGLADALPALSQQASLLTAIVYLGLFCYPFATGLRRHEPRSPWLRGALAVLLTLVCVTFQALLGGRLDDAWSLFEHLLTPLAVLADWLFVGTNQAACRWWYPLSWVAFPLAYLAYYNLADVHAYPFPLNPGLPGFAGYLLGFLAGVLAAGYLLHGAAKLRATLIRPDGGTGRPATVAAP